MKCWNPSGSALEYREYEPLFACAGEAAAKQKKKAFFVTCDHYVTMTDGTGIVHMAPAFGEDDNRVCQRYGLPFVQFVDGQGNMTAETPYAGVFVKKADPLVLADLEKEGKLFDAPRFEHEYPHCWRCDTPLIYYARESWFIRMTAVKDDLIRNNNTINWIPESIGKGRFGDWLENVQDWGISRNRYWGTPLNIWICEDCGHMHSIGSIEELKSMSDNCPDDIELHRPLYRRGDHQMSGVRKDHAARAGGHRLLVRFGLHAFCAASTIRLRIRSCLKSSSRPSLFPRRWIRPEDGSILCWLFPRCCLIRRPMKMLSCWVMCRMKTARK